MSSGAVIEKLSPVAGICGVISKDSLQEDVLLLHQPACPVIAINGESHSKYVDMVLEENQSIDLVAESIKRSPIASATLVQLTRNNEKRHTIDALFAESLAYSTLQHSEQFKTWLATAKPTNIKEFTNQPILIERSENELRLTLNRAENRNAWSTAMRDTLAEHLNLAQQDKSIQSIEISANGPSFCAGGDLTEFGSARDAGEAHVTRQTRSPAALMHLLSEKIRVSVHGACVGAGIELPAFASHISAKTNAFFQLPEVAFGLIPGAGGTASILHRIGKSRFNYMALTGERIDAETALAWGLIDEIEEGPDD